MFEQEVIDLTPLLEESVCHRYEIDAEICNIHGEHRNRIQIIHQRVYDVTDNSSVEEKQKIEKKAKSRSRPENVHSFPIDENGNYIIPFGGAHGYLMGAIRASIPDLYKDKLRDNSWEGYGILGAIDHGVIIKPEWLPVDNILAHPLEEPRAHMTKINGIHESMMAVYFDVVSKANIHLTIDFTNGKIPEKLFLSLLAHTQLLGMGPKGRGNFRILKLVKTKG